MLRGLNPVTPLRLFVFLPLLGALLIGFLALVGHLYGFVELYSVPHLDGLQPRAVAPQPHVPGGAAGDPQGDGLALVEREPVGGLVPRGEHLLLHHAEPSHTYWPGGAIELRDGTVTARALLDDTISALETGRSDAPNRSYLHHVDRARPW